MMLQVANAKGKKYNYKDQVIESCTARKFTLLVGNIHIFNIFCFEIKNNSQFKPLCVGA